MTETKKNHNMKRNMKVMVHVADAPQYPITNGTDKILGTTLEDGLGIYMKDVTFKVLGGKPIILGTYLGTIEKLRFNLSDGKGVMFDKSKNAFTDGENYIFKARMVQLLGGVIKIVIEDE